ncbi:MAG: hypothetical protein HFJ37_05500 [Clostridia bacterium]|nr:hypothetical protein [Clostridia bacterium]
MSNEILNSLLKEYQQKKLNAELDLERRKENLYQAVPRLRQIEEDLNYAAINTAKSILNTGKDSTATLQEKFSNLKKEKDDILSTMNLSKEYLTPFYECKICQDTGYVMDKNYKTQMCNCLKQKLLDYSFHQSNMSNLEQENFANFNELIFSNEVDVAKYRLNISPRSNMINIKNKCMEFVKNFNNPAQKNLLFTGNTGLR